MGHKAQIDRTAFTIDEIEVALGRPVELVENILGPWSREFAGTLPAPTGYRNNIRYIYDDLGISLLDGWTDQCLTQVTFHFSLQRDLAYCPAKRWSGPLLLDGYKVNSDEFMQTITRRIELFRHLVGKIYGAEYGAYHIAVDIADCSKSGKGMIASLSVSLKEARN